MKKAARVAVVGATGYAGFELARLLLRHPNVERPTFYGRNGNAGARCLTEIFPQLRGWGEAPCRPFSAEEIARSGAPVVFLATPHEASLELAPELEAAGVRVIDLSGAFRLRDPELFSRWYKWPAAPRKLLEEAVYGLPEVCGPDRAIEKARLVANPGCYATSVILALRPLIAAHAIELEKGVVCDCKSGASGAGKEPKKETHFVEVNENFRAYGAFTHRHIPEIAAQLGVSLDDLTFTAHLLPVERGILSTIYARLNGRHEIGEIEQLYRRFYAGWPLVRISPAGQLPELQHVTHTNFCDLGFALDESGKRLIVVSCLDNLGKGAAGQAVQNMNAMLARQFAGCEKFDIHTGLL